MRPPTHRQNLLLQPLNDILGTESNVRLLRVLALGNTSFTAGELARRAALGRTSIYPALSELERIGMIEFVGAGAQRLVQLRDRHPLSRILRDLFRAEAQRFEAFTVALRALIVDLPFRLLSAWVGEIATAQSPDTVRLYVVAHPKELEPLIDVLNTRLADLERKYDIHVAVHGLTRSELETLEHTQLVSNSLILVGGVPPVALLERSRSTQRTSMSASHDQQDARSRRLALAIAAKIKRDPGLIAIAENRVKRRARNASAGERRELAEWMRILATMSPAQLRRFLIEDSERAVRLRQTLPALNLLSAEERDAVVESKTDADVLSALTYR
jgi:hypothetical protein